MVADGLVHVSLWRYDICDNRGDVGCPDGAPVSWGRGHTTTTSQLAGFVALRIHNNKCGVDVTFLSTNTPMNK